MDYYPTQLATQSLERLAESLQRELATVSAAINSRLESPVHYLTAAPSHIDDGMIVAADGTAWDPGGGKGLYMRVGAAWVKL